MPRLIAADGSQLMLQGEEVSVGRRDGGSEAIDLDLGNLERGRTVSRRHACIYRQRSVWHLRAETTTNETRVAGKPVKPGEDAPLSDGDEILLGAVSLTFRADADPEITMVRQAQAPAELRSDGLVFPLAAPEGRRLWIGRPQTGAAAPPDMIDLTGLSGSRSVSHMHAQVYRTPAGWILHEGKTTNPTMVSGRELTPGEDVSLTDGVSIQLGRVLLTFHEVRPVRVVTSDILLLEVDREEVTIDPGRSDNLGLRLVNATGRVEQVEVSIEGIPPEWFQVVPGDGTPPSKVWRVQLVPTGPDLSNPVPNSSATARLVLTPPRSPLARAGQYPITIAATTQGEDRVRRVVPARVNLMPFYGLTLTFSPIEAKGSSAKYVADITNTGNTDADVDLVLEADPGLKLVADPERLQMVNGGNQHATLKARVRKHWWGPRRTYGLHVTAVTSSDKFREGAILVCWPLIPEWLQGILSKLFAIFSPIAIPTATLVVLMGLAYLFLRPPEITQYYANAPAVVPGGTVQLAWTADRAASVSLDPAADIQGKPGDGQASVAPTQTTDYNLTVKNWIGLSSSKKLTEKVVRITKFQASTQQLPQEGQEVTLQWETDGADTVAITPADEIKDPKTSDSAKVHPTGNTTYTLTATGPGGVAATQSIGIGINSPVVKKFEVSDPPSGTRVYPGTPIKLNWQADGATKVTISVDKGDVSPGHKTLEVTTGPPATVQPMASGDVTYTLIASNAAGNSDPATVKINVSPVGITQFTSTPDTVAPGASANLAWNVEGANDTTQISIDPDIGKVGPQGQRPVTPGQTTDYTLTVQAADGSNLQQKATVTVKAPQPVISVFTSASNSVTQGDQVRITWQVQGADSIQIKTGDGFLIVQTNQAAGSVLDNPVAPTTYILTATNAAGPSTKDFSVDVKPPGATPVPPTPAPAQQPAAGASPAPAGR